MGIPRSPASAPSRADLTWLRRRTLRDRAPEQPPVTPARISFARARPAGTSLDLSAPGTAAPATAAPATVMPTAMPTGFGVDRPVVTRPVRHVQAKSQTILTPRQPTATLNRLQAGIGTLRFDAVWPAALGDVRLGAVYELADGTSSIVSRTSGMTAGPPGARYPVIVASLQAYEGLTVDLRQSRALSRLVAYAYSESGQPIIWAGTLICETFGGARIELPLEFGQHQGPVAMISVYNVDGEFVLRAERELIIGDVREVARAFGFERIAWADTRSPVP
ncbi:MAG TPA: hypothetical protein VK816_06930 [Jatrophihabitantaceae bacterium]|jgi:hypothetical protein|nr:hypothetical protein [Jatrophihabitantaceae bacterium]